MKKNQYLKRELFSHIKKWMNRKEVLAIKGPRQSGKTTLLKMLIKWLEKEKNIEPDNIIFLTFEDKDILEKFSKNPKAFIKSIISHKKNEFFYIFIDEFHYAKDGGQKLKLLYDTNDNIKFVITGSSSLELTGKTAKYMVGRMFSFYLWQLSFQEFIANKSQQLANVYNEYTKYVNDFIFNDKNFQIPRKDIFHKDFEELFQEYAVWGGYPEVVKTDNIKTKKIILKNIYDMYISEDIIDLLKIADYSKFKKVINLLSLEIGNIINFNTLASDSQSYFKEIKHSLSILEETFIISLIRPFFSNKITEIRKNPKVYFIDSGLRNYTINNLNDLSIRADTGHLAENIILTNLTRKKEDIIAKYWRTLGGAEIDFIIEQIQKLIPLEVKYSAFKSPKVSRGFRSFISEYKPRKAVIFTKNFWGEIKVDTTLIKFVPLWYL